MFVYYIKLCKVEVFGENFVLLSIFFLKTNFCFGKIIYLHATPSILEFYQTLLVQQK